MTRWRVGQFLLINRKNKNRYQNENSQPNCFLSVGPVGGTHRNLWSFLRWKPHTSSTRAAVKLNMGVLVAAVLDQGE